VGGGNVSKTPKDLNPTCSVEIAMPRASTGTVVPSKVLQRRGVNKMAPNVVAVVIITDIATLP
jgi:hypothetical protein